MTPSILNVNSVATMTSREIAELTGKEHKNVLADIRDMLAALSLDTADFSAVYLSENGQYYDCFKLPERECLILVSGYSIAMRAKIIDRWQELEAQTAQPVIDLNNPEHLRGLLGSYAEKAIALQSQLAIAAPKADALDRIAGATGSITIREAAKDLQVKPLAFSNWLKENKWIYKQGRSNLAHQPRIDAGYMAHKVTLVEVEGDDGVTFEKPVTQARITPKGLAKLAVVFGEVTA